MDRLNTVLIFIIVEITMLLGWRGVGHECQWNVCLERRLVERICVVVWQETRECVGSIWVTYCTNIDASFCLCIAEAISFVSAPPHQGHEYGP